MVSSSVSLALFSLLLPLSVLGQHERPLQARASTRRHHEHRRSIVHQRDGSGLDVSVSVSSGSHPGMTPNGIKAGISGGDAFDYLKDHIGWWYGMLRQILVIFLADMPLRGTDWSASPSGHSGSPLAIPMLWGAGTVDGVDAQRFEAFKAIDRAPAFVIGFEEPDCSTAGSAGMDVGTGTLLFF